MQINRATSLRFFIDPVGYIRSLDGGRRIERILFVPPSGEVGPEPPPSPDTPVDPETPRKEELEDGEKRMFDLDIDAEELGEIEYKELLLGADKGFDAQVVMLARAGKLQVADIWEFIPYNNADRAPANFVAFARAVDESLTALLTAADAWRDGTDRTGRIDAEIATLKKIYDVEFGSNSTDRNIISLFLYAGPLPMLRSTRETIFQCASGDQSIHRYIHGEGFRKYAQLSTGDGYLDTTQQLDALAKYFCLQRIAQVGVFQVMHHGARRNWHSGVAERIAPIVSIFSSDPIRNSTFHPHPEVLRDFWIYGPVQADTAQQCCVSIQL